MTTLDPYRSYDDLRLSARDRKPHTSDERRVRSCSPVKTQRNVPGSLMDVRSFKLPPIEQDSVSLLTSGSGSIQEQLKLLSHSPISNRLQISDTSKYTIPIPFTLQLPPKLSKKKDEGKYLTPPGSPSSKSRNLSPKPKRLFYTGTGYNMVESDSETEEIRSKKLVNKLPKRPSITNVQSVKFKVLSKDDLSVIEEISTYSNSRKSSIKSQINKGCYPIGKDDLRKRKIDKSSISYSSPFIGGSDSMYPTSSYTSYFGEKSNMDNYNERTIFDLDSEVSHTSDPKIEKYNLTTNDTATQKVQEIFNKRKITNSMKQKPLPEINITEVTEISTKPSTSSEHIAYYPIISAPTTPSAQTIPSVQTIPLIPSTPSSIGRTTSIVSDLTIDSNSSFGSLQKSIDITNGDIDYPHNRGYISAYDLADSIVSEGMLSDKLTSNNGRDSIHKEIEDDLEHIDTYTEDELSTEGDEEIKPLNISRCATMKSVEKVQSDDEESNKTTDSRNEDDNIGTGKRFSFPNSNDNITNSKEIQAKYRLSTLSSSRHSIQTNLSEGTGQIEIPNLSDLDISIHSNQNIKSTCSVSGMTFDDLQLDTSYSSETTIDKSIANLEPIGVPSKAAQRVIRDQFKVIHHDSESGTGSDTEIDTDIGALSLYNNHRRSKSASNVFDMLKSKPEISNNKTKHVNMSAFSRASPTKHRRHKSMFNIDFEIEKGSKPLEHKIGKSVDLKDLVNRPLPVLPTLHVAEEPKISVEEPPVPITYPIDFKESNMHTKSLLEKNYSSNINFSKFSNKRNLDANMGWFESSIRNRQDDLSSESSSSYQSSRSARYTGTTVSEVSDTDSVFIDLTKDSYDVCTILRNNSTTSYKSTTKKNNNGKEYEIVIVDDADSDELASIYSKYKQNWVTRRNSLTSNQSSASSISYGGSVSSVNQIRLKEYDLMRERKGGLQNNIISCLKSKRSNVSLSSSTSSSLSRSYTSHRIKLPNSHQVESNEI